MFKVIGKSIADHDRDCRSWDFQNMIVSDHRSQFGKMIVSDHRSQKKVSSLTLPMIYYRNSESISRNICYFLNPQKFIFRAPMFSCKKMSYWMICYLQNRHKNFWDWFVCKMEIYQKFLMIQLPTNREIFWPKSWKM